MIKHYLKIAFRNLWKYKGQTLVSVVGLAVGFVCFAMGALWIRYEMTFDSFHANSERMYCVYRQFEFMSIVTRQSPGLLAGHLKTTFPEIEHSVAIVPSFREYSTVEIDDVKYPAGCLGIDSSFFEMFDVKIVEGSIDFILPNQRQIAITRNKALQLFGNETPIGKRVKRHNGEYTICAVVTEFPKHSNYSFDFLMAIEGKDWWTSDNHVIVTLLPETDVEAFEKKLYEHAVGNQSKINHMTLVPITSIHYSGDKAVPREIKFQHIIIFFIAGSLLILCTMFNYLTLFISRFKIRQREFALRTVFGATTLSLFALLSVEFLLSMVAALLTGLFLFDICSSSFVRLSGITADLSSIYAELLIYITGIIMISLLTFLVILTVFRRKELNVVIRSRNRKLFRKTSIVVQLTVSIVFAFCTVVILKQMYHLHNTDLGFTFKNTGSVVLQSKDGDHINAIDDRIKQIPEITETIKDFYPVLPPPFVLINEIKEWDGKSDNDKNVVVNDIKISERYQEFYELRLIEGDFLTDGDEVNDVLINETAAKDFGWHKAVGKSFDKGGKRYRVKGVIQNTYNWSPTINAPPVVYSHIRAWGNISGSFGKADPAVVFKFDEGTWKSCKSKIEAIVREVCPDATSTITSAEEEYDKFLKSETALLTILTVVSLVCLTVCVFGFVSMVSLTCEERRKEIAIRKINGAMVKDILDIFFKEYLTLLVVGAALAFPVGYIVMKRWLESYVVQTEMDVWIYAVILLVLMLSIVICVGGKVYRTSRENPAVAVKS